MWFVSIKSDHQVGRYVPHVLSGTLVVDGVLVSCHTGSLPAVSHALVQMVHVLKTYVLPTSVSVYLFHEMVGGRPRLWNLIDFLGTVKVLQGPYDYMAELIKTFK